MTGLLWKEARAWPTGAPISLGESEEYQKTGEALARPWRTHRSPEVDKVGKSVRKRDTACHVGGTGRNYAQVGAGLCALGREGRAGGETGLELQVGT